MTVSTSTITSGPYTGNGITTTFDYTFKITDSSLLLVYQTTAAGVISTLVLNTDYTVTGVGEAAGGTVVLTTALTTGYTLYIRSNYPLTQTTAFASQGGFFPAVHEAAFDKQTIITQQILDLVNRSLRMADSFSGTVDTQLPTPSAGKSLVWNAAENGIQNSSEFVNAELSTTSTTSLLIGTGSKVFTTAATEQYAIGAWVNVASAANVANFMFGQVTAYSGTTMTVNVTVTGGSGTFADWSITLSGVRGDTALEGTATGVIDLLSGTAIASAATINLNTATGNRVHVTGTTTITAVTLTRGPRTVVFDGVLTLTHHATNNNLPGAANITTAAGDRAVYESDGTTVYCTSYVKASGQAVNDGTTVGTWTPSYSFDSGSATYSVQQGWYFKVGKIVVAGFSLSTNSLVGTSGGAWLTGLPVAYSSDISSQGIRAKGVITRAQSFLGDHPCAIDNMNTLFNNRNTVGLVYRATSNGAVTALNASDFSTAADSNRIDGFVVYMTD